MVFESILSLIPAAAAIAVTAVALYLGYVTASCSIARLRGKECPSC